MSLKPIVQEIRSWTEPDGFAVVTINFKSNIELSLTFNKQKLGGPKLTELFITSLSGKTINTSLIQKLNLGEMIELALSEINKISLESGDFSEAISFISNKNNWRNTGNKPLPDLNFAMTAWVYEYLKTTGTKNVILEIAKLSKVKSSETIKKRLSEAKQRGLLIKGPKGNMNTYGGFLTNKGFTLIVDYLMKPKEKK
jgi:hypothetical protein